MAVSWRDRMAFSGSFAKVSFRLYRCSTTLALLLRTPSLRGLAVLRRYDVSGEILVTPTGVAQPARREISSRTIARNHGQHEMWRYLLIGQRTFLFCN